MKKVFSVEKLEEYMNNNGYPKRFIEETKELWANACDGLTEEEMWVQQGCETSDSWMIEVEEGGE